MDKISSDTIEQMSVMRGATIREAMRAIDRGELGTALIVAPVSKKFLGLVTDGDLRRALLDGMGLEANIEDVPRPVSTTARVGTPPEKLAALFSKGIRLVPLLNEEGVVVDLSIFEKRVSLPIAEPIFGEEELQNVTECVVTGWVSSAGKFVTEFEKMVADYTGTKFAVSASNGTTALHLALLALDIGPGDEVIVPSMTFIATANAVRYTGATPVFVDSEMETWNIDPAETAKAVTPRTRAIIPVHLCGHPAKMDGIVKVAKSHQLAIIEDAAEAQGATFNGRQVGSIGDLGTFSFYGNKIITTGEGGMVTTNDEALAEKLRILRDHGMSKTVRYLHPVLGYNYRMTNLQAALGVGQMRRIAAILEKKREIAAQYNRELQGLRGLTLPPAANWAHPVCWLYSVVVDPAAFGISRNDLIAELKEHNIDSRPLFYPVHKQPMYQTGQNLPNADYLAENGISLPSSVTLTPADVKRVTDVICNAANR